MRTFNYDRDVIGCQIGRVPCTCHDAGAWEKPDAYPNGCSTCGCHRASAKLHARDAQELSLDSILVSPPEAALNPQARR